MVSKDKTNLRLLLIDDEPAEDLETWPLLPAALVLFAVWLAFAWPWLSGGLTIPWDAKAHFAPQVQFMAASFARGELPLWNPYAFGGHPQIADPQSIIFSPPMLLLALFNSSPSLWAIDATVLFMMFVGGFGVIWLVRDLGWHWSGALVAAICFAFGAAMAWRLQHFGQLFSLAYFPIALLLLMRGLQRGSVAYGALAGLIGAFIVLGRDQVALLCVYLLVGYVIWFWFTEARRRVGSLASVRVLLAGSIVGCLLVAIPIAMTADLAAMSNRPFIDYEGAAAGSLHPALLVTSAIPHVFGSAGEMASFWGPPSFTWEGTGLFIAQNMGIVYIGAMAYLLIAIGLLRGVFAEASIIRYFVIAFVIVMLYALGWYTPLFRGAYEFLPGVDLYRRPADAVFVIGGVGAMLAGYAGHRVVRDADQSLRGWQWLALVGLVVLPFALAVGFALTFDRLRMAQGPLVFAGFWFALAAAAIAGAVWLRPIRPILAGLLLVLPLGADLVVNNGPNGASALPAPVLEMLETNKPNSTIRTLQAAIAKTTDENRRPRVELAGLGFHWPNASLSHQLEHTLGYNPVRLKIYSEAVGAGDTVGLPDQRKFTALFPSYKSPLASMLGLRYIATGVPIEKIDGRLKPGELALIKRTREGYVYENPDVLPRVLFAGAAQRADFADIVKTGNWPGGFDATATVLLDEDVAIGLRGGEGRVKIVTYGHNEVVVEAESSAGGWVVLNDIWHPWWRARVNGKLQPVRRANVLFRAVRVDAGRQVVKFTFEPVRGLVSGFAGK